MKKWPPFILMLMTAWLSTACTHHAVPPPLPAPAPPIQSSLAEHTWKMAPLKFSGATHKDRPQFIKALGARFKDYLKARLVLGAESDTPSLTFELELKAQRPHYRTIIFDLANIPFAPFLIGGLINPEWGRAIVGGQLKIYDQDHQLLGQHIATAEESFSILIYSWYRSKPIEDAFEQSYARVFEKIIKGMAKKNLSYPTRTRRVRKSELNLDGLLSDPTLIDPLLQDVPVGSSPKIIVQPTKPPAPKLALTKPAPTVWEEPPQAKPEAKPEPKPEDKDRFRVIHEPNPVVYDTYLMKGLAALGGFEGAYFTGEATVTSSITRENGSSVEVANGRAKHQGYRITLFDVPEATGFYWYPVVGFLDQSIDITDFYEDVPQLIPTVGTDIDADCTQLSENGQTSIPCGQTNTYSLDMQSIVAGLRLGFSVVAGTPYAQIFFTGTAGSNLMEWRSIKASLGGLDQGEREKVEFIQSAAFGSTLGLFFPKLHFSIRGMFNYEIYQSFKFDQPIEFMGPTVCDFAIGRCERERAFVESTSLSSWTMQVAAGVSF